MSIKYQNSCIITNDIYLAAYLLSKGYNPVKVIRNERRRISFLFNGDNVEELREAYSSGPVFLDIRSFRDSLLTVRKLMDFKHPPSPKLWRGENRSALCPKPSRKQLSPV